MAHTLADHMWKLRPITPKSIGQHQKYRPVPVQSFSRWEHKTSASHSIHMSQSWHIHQPFTGRKFLPVTPKNIGRCQKYHSVPTQVLGRWQHKSLASYSIHMSQSDSVPAHTLAGHMQKISACHTKKIGRCQKYHPLPAQVLGRWWHKSSASHSMHISQSQPLHWPVTCGKFRPVTPKTSAGAGNIMQCQHKLLAGDGT